MIQAGISSRFALAVTISGSFHKAVCPPIVASQSYILLSETASQQLG